MMGEGIGIESGKEVGYVLIPAGREVPLEGVHPGIPELQCHPGPGTCIISKPRGKNGLTRRRRGKIVLCALVEF